jgi:hypothetical protein
VCACLCAYVHACVYVLTSVWHLCGRVINELLFNRFGSSRAQHPTPIFVWTQIVIVCSQQSLASESKRILDCEEVNPCAAQAFVVDFHLLLQPGLQQQATKQSFFLDEA